MECSECDRLHAARVMRELQYTVALTQLKTAVMETSRHGEYTFLRAKAKEARICLDSVQAEILQHRYRHGVPETSPSGESLEPSRV